MCIRDRAYAVNVSALEQVQPAPVEAGDIEVHLGATWIPVDVVKDFMVELLEPSWNAAAVMEVIYVSYTGQWNITNKAKGAAANVKANETYGTCLLYTSILPLRLYILALIAQSLIWA